MRVVLFPPSNFGQISSTLAEIQPIAGFLVRPKSVAKIKLRTINRFQTNFGHFGGKQNISV
jgi:hypothetical protein